MFRGKYHHTLDAKGRMIIPSKFREGLGDRFIITKGLDKCLFVFSMEEWEILEQKIEKLPLSSEKARRFQRFFFANTYEAEVDNNGRVIVPADLREYAQIEKEIVSIGVPRRIELWGKQTWDEYQNAEDSEDDMSLYLTEMGI